MTGEIGFVLLPVSLQEDEFAELHSPSNQWDPPEGFFQNDVYPAMHTTGIGYPPQVEPVGIDLVICYEDEPFRKVTEQVPLNGLQQLTTHTFVTTDHYICRSPELDHGGEEKPHGLLRESDPCIVPVLIYEV